MFTSDLKEYLSSSSGREKQLLITREAGADSKTPYTVIVFTSSSYKDISIEFYQEG